VGVDDACEEKKEIDWLSCAVQSVDKGIRIGKGSPWSYSEVGWLGRLYYILGERAERSSVRGCQVIQLRR